MRNHLSIRKFLNLKGLHAGAYIVARVPDSSTCSEPDCDHYWCVDPVLTIADCSRVIDLDLTLTTASDRRNSLRKLDLLIDTLTAFRGAVRVEAERAVIYEKARKNRA